MCFGQTTEYTERENGLHSSSVEVQTALRSKFSYILCAQDDETVTSVHVFEKKTHTPTMFSRADNLGMLPAYYFELQVGPRVHAALLVSQHIETHM